MALDKSTNSGTKIGPFDLILNYSKMSLKNPERGNKFESTHLSATNFATSQGNGGSIAGVDIAMTGMSENQSSKHINSIKYSVNESSYDLAPTSRSMTHGNAPESTLFCGNPPSTSVQNSDLVRGNSSINHAAEQTHITNTQVANGQNDGYFKSTMSMGQVKLYGDNNECEEIHREPTIPAELVVAFKGKVARIKQNFAYANVHVTGLSVDFPQVSMNTTFSAYARIHTRLRESECILHIHYEAARQECISKLKGEKVVPKVFRLFRQLPAELRLKIWELFDEDATSYHFPRRHTVRVIPHQETMMLEVHHPTDEPLLSVSRETRSEMLKTDKEGYAKALVSHGGALVIRPGDALVFMDLDLYTKNLQHDNVTNAFAPFKLVETLIIDHSTLLQGAKGGNMGCIRQNLQRLLDQFPALTNLILYVRGDGLATKILSQRKALRAGYPGAGITTWVLSHNITLRKDMMDEIKHVKSEAGKESRLKDLWVKFDPFDTSR